MPACKRGLPASFIHCKRRYRGKDLESICLKEMRKSEKDEEFPIETMDSADEICSEVKDESGTGPKRTLMKLRRSEKEEEYISK